MAKMVMLLGEIVQKEKLQQQLKERGFICVQTQQADEISQIGKQNSRIALLFSDAKFAYKFLHEHSWSGFQILKTLYLSPQTKLGEEAVHKLSRLGIKIYDMNESDRLIKDLEQFQNVQLDTEDSPDIVDEIEFTANIDLGKKK